MKNLDKLYAERIVQEYAPKTTTKTMQLHKLDRKVKSPAITLLVLFASCGALTLGTGMSFLMSDFGPKGETGFTLGIILGLVGIALCSVAYPLYAKTLKHRREKYAYDIITLADEITKLDSEK